MKIQGRDCSLTLAKDGYYYPLPYSEETVRQRFKGYFLPAVIGKRNREKFVVTRQVIEVCFVTSLDYSCILTLFLLLFNSNEKFDILVDRVCEKLQIEREYWQEKTTLKALTCMQIGSLKR